MTDKPHTPSEDELRRMYALKVPHDQRDSRSAELDRFLAAAEQRGAERALREAAKDWRWSAWADAPPNPIQVLAEAYTLYKKHHDGMRLDFNVAIAQVREESEQRGAERAFRKTQEIIARFDHMYREYDDMINTDYLIQEIDTEIQDLMEGDDETH